MKPQFYLFTTVFATTVVSPSFGQNLAGLGAQFRLANPLDTTCDLEPTEVMLGSMEDASKSSRECSFKCETYKELSGNVKLFYDFRVTISDAFKKSNQAMSQTLELIKSFEKPITKVPGYGTIFKAAITSVKTIDKVLGKLSADAEKLKKAKDHIERVEDLFEKCEEDATFVQETSVSLYGFFSDIKKLSEKNANCGSCVLDQFSSTTTGVWELTDSAFETCVDVLDPNLKIDFKVPPFVQEIVDTLAKLVNAVQNVVDKMSAFVDAFKSESKYVMCCSGSGQAISDVIEALTETFDLLTCWVDPLVDGVVSETLDIVLGAVQVLLEPVNDIIGKVDQNLEKLNDVSIRLPDFGAIFTVPKLEFYEKDEQCALSVIPDKWGQLEFVEFGFNFEGGNELDLDADGEFSFREIGTAIHKNCAAAVKDFATPNDDCCPLARLAKGIDPDGKPDRSFCARSKECKSGRCDATGNGKKCLPQVEDCGRCSGEDSDCLSGSCRANSCAKSNNKVCNGQACTSSNQCDSGRHNVTGNRKKCLAKGANGSKCNENSDCQSSKCKRRRRQGRRCE